jgi:polyprenyl-phospho-N-acetylgalactosaminyl synthase
MKTVAIVPAYNEPKERLSSFLSRLNQYVDAIVVVDDASNSNYEFGYTVLKHKINRGQGAALQTGTDYAMKNGADIIVHMDGDGQHKPENIPNLINPIKEKKADVVFGSKILDKSNKIPWTKKYLIIPVAKIINYLFTGLRLTDVHNGMRAFSSSVAPKLYLTQDRMAHASEYPYLVKMHKLRYLEVPVKVVYNEYGQGIAGGFKILKELFTAKLIK